MTQTFHTTRVRISPNLTRPFRMTGVIQDTSSLTQKFYLGLIRNAILTISTALGIWSLKYEQLVHFSSIFSKASVKSIAGRKNGMSVIELIVVIIVVGLLIAILLPALQASRTNARKISDLSNLSHHSKIFSTYTNDYRETYPIFMKPIPGDQTVSSHVGNLEFGYFSQSFLWPYVLITSGYYDAALFPEIFSIKSASGDNFSSTTFFYYGPTFFTSPAYWNPLTRRAPPDQLTPVRSYQVTFPSLKGLMDRQPQLQLAGRDAALKSSRLFTNAAFGISDHSRIRPA